MIYVIGWCQYGHMFRDAIIKGFVTWNRDEGVCDGIIVKL